MTDLRFSCLVLSFLLIAPACSGEEFTEGSSLDASPEAAAGGGSGGSKPDAGVDAKDAAGGGKESGADAQKPEAGKEPVCGNGACEQGESCAVCPSDCPCPDGCVPQCENKQCGDDSCGGSCGECPDGQDCAEGVCPSSPGGCGNGQCDQTAGENCLNCYADCKCLEGQSCLSGTCCTPACVLQGSLCGFDTCGGVACGGPTCKSGQACLQGQCIPSVTCGNNACDATETCESCNWDCKCPTGMLCTAGGICK